jgi:hypothetical protein
MKRKKLILAMLRIMILWLILSNYSCVDNSNLKSDEIIKVIEAGTDSTTNKVYDDKKLQSITAHNFKAVFETSIMYNFKSHNQFNEQYIYKISSSLMGNPYGHFFKFYQNGQIENYKYLVKSGTYTYSRSYNDKGKILNEEGNPFVDYFTINDSSLELHFSNVFYDSLKVEIRKGNERKILELSKSPMEVMLLKGLVNTKYLNSTLNIKGINTRTKEEKIYVDTIYD